MDILSDRNGRRIQFESEWRLANWRLSNGWKCFWCRRDFVTEKVLGVRIRDFDLLLTPVWNLVDTPLKSVTPESYNQTCKVKKVEEGHVEERPLTIDSIGLWDLWVSPHLLASCRLHDVRHLLRQQGSHLSTLSLLQCPKRRLRWAHAHIIRSSTFSLSIKLFYIFKKFKLESLRYNPEPFRSLFQDILIINGRYLCHCAGLCWGKMQRLIRRPGWTAIKCQLSFPAVQAGPFSSGEQPRSSSFDVESRRERPNKNGAL